jgi:hypothetical protein
MPIIRVSASPTITAGTFAVGDAVGTQLSFSTGQNAGSIIGCRMLDKGRQSVPLELWLFRASTTGTGLSNNDPFGPSDTQIANSAGVIRVTDWFHTPENSAGQAEDLPFSFASLTGGVLYGWLVCCGSPTYAAGDLTVELLIQQGVSPIDRRRMYYYRRRPYPPLTALTIPPAAENYHTIHLKFDYQPPANLPPSTVQVTGSYLLGGRWVDFHPALLDDGGANTLYTILFGLQEGKTYPVKIEFKRTNNATGALIERKTYHKLYTTRSSPQSGSGGSRYMSPTGKDSNTGVNTTDSPAGTGPKKTIAGLAAVIPTGGIGILLNGTYSPADYGLLNGKAAAGGSNTITLDGSARAIDSFYNDWTVTIVSGTAAGQSKTITGYVGSTKVATVNSAWTLPAPDTSSVYHVTKSDLGFDTTAWEVANLVGASTAYKTIRAETTGQVSISGKRLMSTANGLDAWTRDIAPGRTFNGTSTWLGNTSGVDFLSAFITASAGTIAGWIKVRGTPPTNANAYGLDCIFADTSGFAGLFVGTITGDPNGARVWASNWDGNQDRCDGAYTANTWTHVAWVHGGGTLKLYVNGTLANSVASGDTSELGNRIRFGLRNTEYFEGAMSLWGAWNIALSDGDISSLAAGSDPNEVQAASLKGRWPINGASPETETIQGHNLTVNGSAGTETGPTRGDIYYAEFSAFMDTTNKRASRWVKVESGPSIGKLLYLYGDLTTDQTVYSAGSWKAIRNGTREGFLIDWTNNRIYVRVPLGAGSPPDARYSCGWHQGEALDLSACDYLILEGITLEMFGSIEQSGGGQYFSTVLTAASRGGLRLYDCTNVVVRNCAFNQGTVANGNSPTQSHMAITIEDCTFSGHDWWSQLYTNPLVSNKTWATIKSTPNEDYTVMFQVGDVTTQLVIRRCDFTGCDDGLSLNSTTGNNDCDIYENTFTNMFDGAVEANSADSILRNTAFWHNTFTNCLYAFRFTALTNGPAWVVGNYGTDCGVFNTLYIGMPNVGQPSDAHTLVYCNTLLSETANDPASGSSWNLGLGTGRVKLINNVLEHAAHYFGDNGTSGYDSAIPNIVAKNCFYSPYPAPRWRYNNTAYAYEADYLGATASTYMTLSGNVYIDPYPPSGGGALDSQLVGVASPIRGITNIAADSAGNPLNEPLALGYFPKWQS